MTIEFTRLDHIQICIPTGAEARAREFYCDILGLSEIDKPDALKSNALKSNGGFWLQVDTTPPMEIHISVEDGVNKSKRQPAFEVNDIHAVRRYLESKHVKLKADTPIPNVTRFSLFDPWDNRIDLLQKRER